MCWVHPGNAFSCIVTMHFKCQYALTKRFFIYYYEVLESICSNLLLKKSIFSHEVKINILETFKRKMLL